jgi:hypothetical protein
MKIGYCVEGATDRAVVVGLQRRWCPEAELVQGKFRGTTGLRLRAEIPSICAELDAKGCDVIVFLTDANTSSSEEVADIEEAQKRHVPASLASRVLSGVAVRNIEGWLCSDRDWVAGQTGRRPAEFAVDDPKGMFESAMGITSSDRQETRIADLVYDAPLRQWMSRSRSFERFYEDARGLSRSAVGKSLGCSMPNERENVPRAR